MIVQTLRFLFSFILLLGGIFHTLPAGATAPTNCNQPFDVPAGVTLHGPGGKRMNFIETVRVNPTSQQIVKDQLYCQFSSGGVSYLVKAAECSLPSSNLTQGISDMNDIVRHPSATQGSSFGDRLAQAAWDVTAECIPTSKTFRREKRNVSCIRNRYQSGWACLRGVRYAVADALGRARNSISLGEHAKNSGPSLMAYGFQKNTSCNPRNAPNGAVLVYSGGTSGHAEIKVDRGNGQIYYCSDYCATEPRNEASSARHFRACYVM